LGAAFLGNPGIAEMVAHHPLLYSDLSDPVALLRGEIEQTELGRFWPYARAADRRALGREGIAPYTTLMSASQSLVARQVLDAYPLERHRCLLDVGGGDGAFLETVASRAPDLRLVCFDLPPVAELAQERFSRRGLSHRATAVGGDFHSDPLPEGADVVSLVRIICDQDDDEALALLRAVRHAMSPDAVLLLAESMAETEGAEPIGDAYFGLYLLAMGSGRARSATELRELVQAAGFRDVRIVPTRMPLQAGLLVARS
ncbi:MAG TPA: methyltransferase, partial [Myxococcota bacterium]|nr:methyltransferase [Myxococcota bacterium]